MIGLTGRALDLYREVAQRAPRVEQQVALLTVWAGNVGASSKDVAAVKAFLEQARVTECRG